jgi:hypothetical protein
MIVYQKNPDGLYLGPVEADQSPLEPGVWLIPGGCVEVAPPEIPEGMLAVWQSDQWSLLPVPSDDEGPDEPPPPDPVVPAYVRKLALVRALRMVGLDGDPDNPVKAWPVIRAAIEAADEDTREDWTLAVEIPRDDPALDAIAGALDVPAGVLDEVFILAAQSGG